jgi:cytochrome b6-f complex iron-sulfur subunit
MYKESSDQRPQVNSDGVLHASHSNKQGPGLSRRELIQKSISIVAWGGICFSAAASVKMGIEFFYPSVVFHPPSVFEIGQVKNFITKEDPDANGVIVVNERFKKDHRFFVIREKNRIYALYARCTHLGCTVNWFSGIRTYKCPCHGSEFHSNGINFAGPAPRPLDRLHIQSNAVGNIIVDTDRIYSEKEFEDKKIFIEVST